MEQLNNPKGLLGQLNREDYVTHSGRNGTPRRQMRLDISGVGDGQLVRKEAGNTCHLVN